MGTRGHLRALNFSISTPRVPVSAQSAREYPWVPASAHDPKINWFYKIEVSHNVWIHFKAKTDASQQSKPHKMELFQLWQLLQETVGLYKHLGHYLAYMGTNGHSRALVGTYGHSILVFQRPECPWVPRVPASTHECLQVPMTQKSTDFTKLRSHIMFEYILKPKQMHHNCPNLIKWSCFNFDNFYRKLMVCTRIRDLP